ncbi:MAG TPA: class I SAM-dependent rRNA methyltransferase [Chthoniobacterales bacterium]|jgi:23S rRNA (cytosine1962-C5)-methyltransferase|nr:class I SAM-dependent rRNA methyltransferase [Chthoniobacterales bacterium]
MAGIVVKPRARIFHGHDWVYGSEVLKTFGHPEPGDVISLKDGQDRSLGSAIYNPNSQIIARRFSRRKQELDRQFFERRISQALAAREKLGILRNPGRIVSSESDGLPGLIIDRYGSHLVLQTLTLAMDRRKELIAEVAKQLLSPTSIVERNDAPIRKAEGLESITGFLFGEQQEQIELEAKGIRFHVDLLTGHKTGLYLDQLDNYETVAELAGGMRVLDCFSNQGAFAVACAKAGASAVTAVEISGHQVKQIKENAQLNGVTITTVEENVFDYLSRQIRENAQFDLIILDPPSFTKSKESLNSARRGYKEIHLRALQLLSPNGYLATFSCSHHVSREMFLEMIVDASVDAKRYVRIVKYLSQPLDHPVLPHIPETEYLKGYLLQVLPGR